MQGVKRQIEFEQWLILLSLATPTLPIGLLTLIGKLVPNFECLVLSDALAWMFLFLNPLLGLLIGIKGLLGTKTRWKLRAVVGIFLNVIYIPLWMVIFVSLIHSRRC